MIHLMDLFFTLFNFCIVVVALIYLVKTYLIPQVKEKMLKEHTDFVELHTEHHQLAQDQKTLEDEIVSQEDRAKILFKKINQWRNVVDVAVQTELAASKQMRKDYEERYAESARIYVLHTRYHEVAPLVIQKLKQDFQKQFADSQEGHAYLAQVLKKLSV